MKNSFSKTLLCGVIASSFILINCQKAPNRAVKAQTAADGATGTAANADQQVAEATKAGKIILECSKEFSSVYSEFVKLNENIRNQIVKISSEPSAEVKKELNSQLEDLNTKADAVLADIRKQNDKADGCKVTDAKTQKVTSVYMVDNINNPKNETIKKAADVAKLESTELITSAKTAAADREKKRAESSLSNGTEFIVSKDLADVLDSEHKDGAAIILDGKIQLGKTSYDAAMADKTKTVCYITLVGDSKPDANSKMKVLAVNSKKDNATAKTSIVVGLQGSSNKDLFEITCQIAEGKVSSKEKEFRNAMGANLLTQKQLDLKKAEEAKKADETKKEEAVKADEAAKVEKAKAASEEAAKKQKADIEKAAKAAADKAAAEKATADKAAADKTAKKEDTKKDDTKKADDTKAADKTTASTDDAKVDDVVPTGP